MNYPLNLSFKILAIARQLSVTDSTGQLVFYVKQKAFRFKEAITIFADTEQTQPLYTINADRVIDFSARYNFADQAGNSLGSIKRKGFKSLWRSRYDLERGDTVAFTIQEANPWTKVLDGLFSEIPIAGIFAGYLFNPAYEVLREDGTKLMRATKQPAFLEGKFTIEKLVELEAAEEKQILLGLIMLVLLERNRG